MSLLPSPENISSTPDAFPSVVRANLARLPVKGGQLLPTLCHCRKGGEDLPTYTSLRIKSPAAPWSPGGERRPRTNPGNLMIICMDNGIYEASGKSATVNAGRTDFVKTARGLGIGLARSVDNPGPLVQAVKELIGARECSFLHVIIAHREGPFKPFRFRPSEMKNQFLSAL